MKNSFSAKDWAAVIVAAVASIALTRAIPMEQKWADIWIFSTLLFATLALVYRPEWRITAFRQTFLVLFLAHILASVVVLHNLSFGAHGIPSLVMSTIVLLEGILMILVIDHRLDV